MNHQGQEFLNLGRENVFFCTHCPQSGLRPEPHARAMRGPQGPTPHSRAALVRGLGITVTGGLELRVGWQGSYGWGAATTHCDVLMNTAGAWLTIHHTAT